MDKKHVVDQLPDYLDNLLEERQKNTVAQHLKTCEYCTKELEELKTLYTAFANEPMRNPSKGLRDQFFEQLKLEKLNENRVIPLTQRNTLVNNLFKIAASIAVLVGVFFLGKQQQTTSSNNKIASLTNENEAFKQTVMLSLMENKSASRRIQGVNYMQESEQLDEAIVNALAERMLYDENTNVRAAAVEVLASFTNSEHVKDTFIRALKVEKDPGIQITIIQTLGKIQEKKAAEPMQKLLEEDETQPFVKEQIESVLTTII